ncbi:MAG: tRNA lysidine(34) synthetase TilS [Bacteroidales bacterium]|nr:tRNA lysidine(34) synthetase TilS [Bacteroidales bacterium]
MFQRFEKNIIDSGLAHLSDRLVVGLSGGADSVALVHLLHRAGFMLIAAHCNFGLRQGESDEDEEFVRSFAAQLNIELNVKRFETMDYAARHRVSIQVAARELRYAWFEQLRQEKHCQAVAVGHHADDQLETFFINLIRGSGIGGLKAMRAKNGHIIRPLLDFRREEIETYLQQNNLSWRDDSSNTETKYLRNQLRHWVLPAFQQIGSDVTEGILNSLGWLQQDAGLFEYFIRIERERLLKRKENVWVIEKAGWMEEDWAGSLLFGLLAQFGFKGALITAILRAIPQQAGTRFYSATHCITMARNELSIEEISYVQRCYSELIQPETRLISSPLHIGIEVFENHPEIILKQPNSIALLDFDSLKFPLKIRLLKKGDRFQPFGVQGSRLVSDFLTDLHISRVQKEKQLLLADAEDTVLWIPGLRINGQFAIGKKTKTIWKATLMG